MPKPSGPWSEDEIGTFLAERRIPIRVACNGRSGHPVLASLWFVYAEGRLWCAPQRKASLVRILERDPRCAFEVSVEDAPYFGVRGRARASLHEDRGEEMLRALIARYLGDDRSEFAQRLLGRVATETAIAIEPETLVSWDFRERMEDAV